jgi:DNA polymerase-3 subunit delta'
MMIGHNAIRKRLSGLAAAGKLPQTSLFYGLNGSGKKTAAVALAGALLCDSPVEADGIGEPCGACRSCHLLNAGNHPDFFLIAPVAPKSRAREAGSDAVGTIKAEQVSEMRQKLAFPPLMGDRQIVVIDNAELMSDVAANSLLKILEEPRPHQTFILVTSRLHGILVTIRSRAAKFFFPPLSREEVETIVRSRGAGEDAKDLRWDNLEFALECFPGAPTLVLKALRMPFDPSRMERLAARERGFIEANALAGEVAASGTDLGVFLQALRHFSLKRLKDGGDAASWIGFIERVALAEKRLDMSIKDEFVLEHLFM